MISQIYKAISVFCLLLVFNHLAGQNKMITRTDTTILKSDSVYLSVGDYRGQVQWQSSSDSLLWLDIAGANTDTLKVLVDSSAVYRAMISENSCDPIYSDTVYLFEDRKTTMAASVILLPDQQWQSSIDTTQSDSVAFVFDYSTNELDTIQIGDFLFSDAGEGYVNKIVDVNKDTTKSTISITTAPSSILEIFSDLYVEHTDTLKNDPSVPYSLSKGVQLNPYGNKGLEVLHFDLNAVLHDLDGDLDTDNDQIRITGEYWLEPKINTDILIQDKALKRIYFEYEFKNTYDLNITIANGINTDDKFVKDLFKKPKKLARISVPTPIGVPLIFVPELQIEVGAELGVESEISAGIQHVSTSRTAMIYQNGYWRTEKSKTRETNPVLPSLENTKAYAKVFVKPEIAIKLYRFIGPYADLEVYGELDVVPFYDPWWQFYLGAKMGVGFKLEAFGISGFDFRADIFDYKYVIAHAETSGNIEPTAAISAEPSTGIPGTTFNFSASGSSDSEDEISDLEVRWDWENDGTWDTPYSGVKLASHTYDKVGTYTVKLQVMDKDGATGEDETTVVVAETENALPVALFNFSPGTPEPGEQIMFNASASYDPDGIDSELEYAWDWENDGELDTGFSNYQYGFHSYPEEGQYQVRLVVKDPGGALGTFEKEIRITMNGGVETGTVTDIEGNIYKTVKIGNQWWMAENLKTTRYNDGTIIPFVKDATEWANLTTPGYCWYSNWYIDNDPSYKDTYGALYNWYTVNTGKLCPTGWHVPTDQEWKQLEIHLGMSQGEVDNEGLRGTNEGGKLKETGFTHWASPNTGATNETLFTALPGGSRGYNGAFSTIYNYGYWWSITENDSDSSWRRVMSAYDSGIYRISISKYFGLSVRCLMD
jgi:uncharacterized protein (TIGR02145 family)